MNRKPNPRQAAVIPLCDGIKSSKEIAAILGEKIKYVQEVMLKFDLPRLPQAPRRGKNNPSWKGGRVIDLNGYVLIPAPKDHPYLRSCGKKNSGRILEHRLTYEDHIGRYLKPREIVDHIDGLTIHNDINNLRLFDNNAQHLKETISGQVPVWSDAGLDRMNSSKHQRKVGQRVDRYHQMKKSGDARLLQILLAWLQLGKDSPHLLGTHRYLKKAEISDLSRKNLKHSALALCKKWELNPDRYKL